MNVFICHCVATVSDPDKYMVEYSLVGMAAKKDD